MKPVGVALAVAVVVAWPLYRTAMPDLDATTAERLAEAADGWCAGPVDRDVPPNEWPPVVRELGPRSVRVAAEGAYIRFGSFFVEERGLFVPRAWGVFLPAPDGDPSYRLLRGRVYRYEIKG